MNKLNIKTISCCGANELLKEKDLINFLKKNPNVEIGVGVSSNKCMEDMPRYVWVADLFEALQKEKNIKNLALHVNGDWNKEIIVEGKLPKNLNYFLYRSYKKMIRMQLNFVGSGYEFNDINPENFADLIESSYAEVKFILPYNEKSSKFIKALYSKTQWFDVLYDKSFGFGKLSNEYDSTFAGKLLQGYAGGLSPENVKCELDKINKAQPFRTNVWIDAEGKLRNDNINTLDLNKAQKFVNEINDWGPSYSIEKEQ